MAESVAVIGGGLAGMVAALELLERGVAVQIFESSDRMGGKAGANKFGKDFDEHGWHLFPLWYLNIWSLIDRLGIRSSFVDKTKYGYMSAGKYPDYVYLENPFSWRTSFHNLFHGVLPPWNSFLYQYAMLDLMAQPYRKRAELDQITVNGFARSRFYGTEKVVAQLEDTVSRASAIESYEMSAMTVRNVMHYWFAYHDPWFRILTGDLQTKFIEPIEKKLRGLGCQIHLSAHVTHIEYKDNAVVAITIRDGLGESRVVPVDNLLITTAQEDTKPLLNEKLLEHAPELSEIYYLRSRVMAGLTIYLKKRVPGLPKDHINFVKTKYALSMIDVSDVWGETNRSVICVVVSDYTTLQGHSSAAALTILMSELRRYVPFLAEDNIERIDFQPHVENPLFANTAGAWPKRPSATTAIPNLFMAGDYCKSHVDLTCMEGAVSSGLLAADAIRMALGVDGPIKILQPKTRPRLLFVALKVLLAPAAVMALLLGYMLDRDEE